MANKQAVKRFEIHLDVDSCQRLYDYFYQEQHNRPENGWDLPALISRIRSRTEQITNSKNDMIRLFKLAAAHVDVGFFEKVTAKVGENDHLPGFMDAYDSEGTASVDLPCWVLPVFQPGNRVCGHVILETDYVVDAENVKLWFQGSAKTNHRVHTGRGYYDMKGEESYLNSTIILWKKTGSVADKNAESSPNITVSDVIQQGRHCFPFDLQMPTDARPSIPPLLVKSWSDYAFLTYFLKVTLNKGKCLRRGNVVTHQPLWVDREQDLARSLENLRVVRVEQIYKTGFFDSSKVITCQVTLPQQAYIRGASIPVRVEIVNKSGSLISDVTAYAEIIGFYRKKKNTCAGCVQKYSVKAVHVSLGPVSAGMCPVLQAEVPLDFLPGYVDGELIPVGPLEDCGIIGVNYIMHVVLKRKCPKRNVHVRIPIEVGTHNSSQLVPDMVI